MGDQFCSVFTEEDTSDLPDLGPSHTPSVPPIKVNIKGVLKLLKDIKPHKASGPDNIPARLLKEAAEELAPGLTHLFQISIDSGKIPHDWKSALVTPVFKKGNRSGPSNYRPISLTSIVCKTLEHVIHSSVISHLEKHNLLTDHQHGFRKRRSCETQLLLTINDLAKGLNDKQQIDAILLDFSKAFDKVPHQRLLLKLNHYGIRNNILAWIKDFLSARTQEVVIDGSKSTPAPVTSGVPQGTVLGPLLFLAYINDMPECVKSSIKLFADDSLLYRKVQQE
ncbi:MAG: reverse transcriptase family protein, partial [Candidatus Thiodiazotropha taylori]|nr:reverse transcriptase family protein [Candidatus Thiodiazotropha taylori]MCW4335137.1 reverse transcriptase family protein [Candidatus Thiodiazotropha endolucinida]